MKKIYCDIKKCLGCGSCEIACAVEHSRSKTLDIAIKEELLPIKRRKAQFIDKGRAISTGCHHCEDAACVTACMSAAMYKDKKTGQTMHDADKCIGCWMCIMSCPFGALTRERQEKVIVKCDLCPDRDVLALPAGRPACVEACHTKALFLGTLEEFKVRT
ncbi:MAG: 4Fe-4S dicluster domain-containing protein [Candidatus Omnitrophica bacterium]|nr:4Fe-4S dicluster domain-containing protein [Candidatus Omnitrophota bacterium]